MGLDKVKIIDNFDAGSSKKISEGHSEINRL